VFDVAARTEGHAVTPRALATAIAIAAALALMVAVLINAYPTTTGTFPRFYKSESGFTYKGDPTVYHFVLYFSNAEGYFCSKNGRQRNSPWSFQEFADKLFLYKDEKVTFDFLSFDEMRNELRRSAIGLSPEIKFKIRNLQSDSTYSPNQSKK
jgi:hypothetical protein